MVSLGDLRVGTILENREGLRRKIIATYQNGLEIEYLCLNGTRRGKIATCFVSTFLGWAKCVSEPKDNDYFEGVH